MKIKENAPENKMNLLTRDQVCSELNISKTTLWRYENLGILIPKRIRRRVLYKLEDVIIALK